MPFKPHQELIIIEVRLLRLLRALESGQPNERLDLNALIKSRSFTAPNIPEDKASEATATLLLHIFKIIYQSILIKKFIIDKVELDVAKQNQNMRQHFENMTLQYIEVKEKYPEAFQYLLDIKGRPNKTDRPNKAARDALYFLIFSQLMHHTLWKNAKIIMEWLIDLSETSDDMGEKIFIEYIAYTLEELEYGNIAQRIRRLTAKQLANPYIQADLSLRAPQLNLPSLFHQSRISLRFSKNATEFSQYFYHSLYAYYAIKQLSRVHDPLVFLDMMHEYSQSSYRQTLINDIHRPQTLSIADKVLLYISETYESMRFYSQVVTLLTDNTYISAIWHHELMHLFIDGYAKVHETPHEISPYTYAKLLDCLTCLIDNKSYTLLEKNPVNEHKFWNAAFLICQNTSDDVPQLIENVFSIQKIILDRLIKMGMIAEAQTHIIKVRDLATQTIPKRLEQAFYHQLLALLKINESLDKIGDIESSTESSDVVDLLAKILQEIIAHDFDAEAYKKEFAKVKFDSISENIKNRILRKIYFLTDLIELDTLNDEQKMVLLNMGQFLTKTLTVLDATSNDLEFVQDTLKSNEISSDELFALEHEKSESKDPSDKKVLASKKCKASSKAAAASSMSLFAAPTQNQEKSIKKEDLPTSLIRFANAIKESLGKDVILNGSAVTNLFLQRPNPHDYDCLILDSSHEELIGVIKGLGYQEIKIVGKEYPTLHFNLEDGLHIDLSTASTQGIRHLPLQEKMAKLLTYRDFKMCALYINLNDSDAHFIIKGFNHAIRCMNQKLISIVESRIDVFVEDPSRLFRLVKLNLQYPDFKVDGFLTGIINRSCKPSLFEAYFKHAEKGELYQRKIGSHIEDLFARFGIQKVLQKMDSMGLLFAFSGFKLEELNTTLPLLLDYIDDLKEYCHPLILKSMSVEDYHRYVPKLAFYQFLQIHYHLKFPKPQFNDWVFNEARLKLRDRDIETFHIINEQFGMHTGHYREFPGGLYNFIKAIKSLMVKPAIEESISTAISCS